MPLDSLTIAQGKTFPSSFGPFTCKIPSLKKRLEIEKRRQRYAEGMMVLSPEAWETIDAMCYLDVCVTEAPEGWTRIPQSDSNPVNFGGFDYDEVFDIDAVIALGKEVSDWVNSFRAGVRVEQAAMGDQGQPNS